MTGDCIEGCFSVGGGGGVSDDGGTTATGPEQVHSCPVISSSFSTGAVQQQHPPSGRQACFDCLESGDGVVEWMETSFSCFSFSITDVAVWF